MNRTERRWLIFGGGFGIYGYLPAILLYPRNKVYLNIKYKKKITERIELNKLLEKIFWYKEIDTIIQKVNSVVVATNPEKQEEIILDLLNHQNINNLILEKPLAVNPRNSIKVLSKLIHSNKEFVFGYSFLYTNWSLKVKKQIHQINHKIIYFDWFFMAHHFKNNLKTWKNNHLKGGGVIRFYGIHLIALLAEFGYSEVNYSKIKVDREGLYTDWKASFLGKSLPACRIQINTKSHHSKFNILGINKKDETVELLNLKTPFDEERPIENYDKRVSLLSKIISDARFVENSQLYKTTNNLWKNCEEKLIFEK